MEPERLHASLRRAGASAADALRVIAAAAPGVGPGAALRALTTDAAPLLRALTLGLPLAPILRELCPEVEDKAGVEALHTPAPALDCIHLPGQALESAFYYQASERLWVGTAY